MNNFGGGAEVICGDNMPPPIGIGLTDLPYIEGGGQCPPPGPLGSGITAYHVLEEMVHLCFFFFFCVRPESNKF